MTTKEKKIDNWALAAYQALAKERERCDEESGQECRGVRCLAGAHRAMVYLHRIMDEVAR
jgi:hypothetical protein